MHESEFGMIPKGWKMGSFKDILRIEVGGDWGKDDPFEDSVPVISLRGTDLEQLKAYGYAPNAPLRWVKKNSLDKRKICYEDVLIAGSGLGPIGRSLYCDEHLNYVYDYPVIYSNFCKKLRALSPAHALYAERLFEIIYLNGEMRQYFTGTSIPNLDINSLLSYKIVIPDCHSLKEYFRIIGKLKFGFLLSQENVTLSQIRDRLLPKMMSEEIEV
jgi:type I restriction enzyme S subunit